MNGIVSLRRAASGDARLLAQLGARLFEQTFGAANDPEDMRMYLADAFSIDSQAAELAAVDRATWIAEDAGKAAVGYAMLHRGTRADGVVADAPAEIQRIYVDGSWQGKGVSRSLVNACVEQARAWHCDTLWLGVWEKNARAIAFYEKIGLRVVGALPFTLGRDLQQDLVMARPISKG